VLEVIEDEQRAGVSQCRVQSRQDWGGHRGRHTQTLRNLAQNEARVGHPRKLDEVHPVESVLEQSRHVDCQSRLADSSQPRHGEQPDILAAYSGYGLRHLTFSIYQWADGEECGQPSVEAVPGWYG